MRHRIAAVLLLAAPLLAAHADGPHYVAEIPFQSCAGLICLQATIDGTRRQTLALDTGNIHSALSWTKAQALGWTLEPYRGRDGKPVAGMAFSGPHMVQLGAVAIPSRMLVFQEDPPPARPDPYDGTLAFTDLKDRVLQIDYVHHLLRISEVLTDSGTSPLPGTLKTITFGNKGPAILTGGPFSVNGYTVQAQIDTCYTGTLLIYDAAATKLGLGAPAGNGRPRLFPYTDGGVTMLALPAQSIGFAGRNFKLDQPTLYRPTPGVHQPDGLFEATAGNELFQNSVVTLDLHHMTFDVQQGA